jgi:hypothetical protein
MKSFRVTALEAMRASSQSVSQVVTAITGVSEVIENPSQETKEQMAGVVDNAIAAAKLAGTGVSGSYASSVLSLVATASAGRAGGGNKQKGRRLLEESAAGVSGNASSSLPTAAVSLLGTLSALADLLSPLATPATGPSSGGSKGLYVTVANLIGSNLQQQVVAAGSVMVAAPGSGDSSMLVANATSAANVRLAFFGTFAGPCEAEATAAGEEGAAAGAGPAANPKCADGTVALRLFSVEDASVYLGESYSFTAGNSSSSTRRRLLALQLVAGTDLEVLSSSVYMRVGDEQQLPCDTSGNGSCSATLTIPVTTGVTPGDPQVQCLLLEAGSAYTGASLADGMFTEAVGPSSEDPAVSVAKCRVTQSGTYAVGRLQGMSPPPSATNGTSDANATSTATVNGTDTSGGAANSTGNGTDVSDTTGNATTPSPSPSPSPSINITGTNNTEDQTNATSNATFSPSPPFSPSPLPSPPPSSPLPSPSSSSPRPSPSPQLGLVDNTTAGAPPTGKIHTVALAVTFPLDYLSLKADSEKEAAFITSVTNSVAAASKVPAAWVNVTRLRPGSVVADVLVTVPAATYSLSQALEMTAAVTDQPDVVFQQMKQTFGIVGPIAAAVTASKTEKPKGRGVDALTIALGVGIGVGGALLLSVAWGLIVMRKRHRQAVHLVEFDGTAQRSAPEAGASHGAQPSGVDRSRASASGPNAGHGTTALRTGAHLS